jgi:hypothetical protein
MLSNRLYGPKHDHRSLLQYESKQCAVSNSNYKKIIGNFSCLPKCVWLNIHLVISQLRLLLLMMPERAFVSVTVVMYEARKLFQMINMLLFASFICLWVVLMHMN